MLAAGPSGFYNAPTTKGILLVVGSLSLLSSILQIKTDFHLQLVPHLTTHHQFWRLITSHFAFATSTEVLFGGLIIYHLRIIERLFGPAKYVSFLFVSAILCTFLNIAVLVTGNALGLNALPSGPYGVIFAAVYQFYTLIPVMYEFKIFGVAFSDKVFMYVIAAQLMLSHMPGSIALAVCGLLSAIRSTATTFESRTQTRSTTDRPAQAMREYLNVLSTGGAPQGGTPRPPSEEQIATLQAIFPTATQDQAIAALNSANNNLDGAVQYLLENQPDAPPSSSS